jgi:hypothetical protein
LFRVARAAQPHRLLHAIIDVPATCEGIGRPEIGRRGFEPAAPAPHANGVVGPNSADLRVVAVVGVQFLTVLRGRLEIFSEGLAAELAGAERASR